MDEIKIIKSEVEELLKKLNVSFEEIIIKTEGGTYFIQIKSQNEAPFLIGRHGERLQAIQRIMEVILFKIFGENVELVVNVNDYLERQRVHLEKIAEKVAQKVIITKKEEALKFFSPYERKIIHQYIGKNHPKLTSYSKGEGPERVLFIAFKN
jgi:spoIIIJ-associated protein